MNHTAEIRQGNIEVFNQVFYDYHRKLYYYVLKKTKSVFCAEEVVQITFIKLWQYRQALNETLPLEMQIFRIAKTTLIDQLRKVDASERMFSPLHSFIDIARPEHADDELNRNARMAQLQLHIAEMSPMRRRVFEMSRLQGLTHVEIAGTLSITVKTVENHINHALKMIRKKWLTLFLPFFMLIKYFLK